MARLADHYQHIPTDDPARIEAERELDGLESREFYRGMVHGFGVTHKWLESANLIIPRWLHLRLMALAAKASSLAIPLGKSATLRNPLDSEMYETFINVVGHVPHRRRWKALLILMDGCPSGSLKGPDCCITWREFGDDLLVTIRGARGAKDSI
jgi:hypothetical protein